MRKSKQDADYARLAARALAGSDPSAGATSVIADRAAAIGAIGSALAGRARARRLLRAAVGLGSVAAVVAGGLWLASVAGIGPLVRGGGTPPAVRASSALTVGSRLRAPSDGDLVAVVGPGTRVRLTAGAVARVTDLGALDRFELESGTLDAKVAKLASGQRFVVVTRDAEVEVRGTEFEVTVQPEPAACAPEVRTRVVVREGVVVVRHWGSETRVPAGASWPDCGPSVAAPSRVPAPAVAERVARGHRGGGPPSGAHTARLEASAAPAEVSASTLAEQNDLFAAALAARRRGDLEEAGRWLDRLLARYPHGQLVETARAERQRLVESVRAAGRSE